MKVYIEEIEDLSTHGVTTYSLITGMEMHRAEVRASGIEIATIEGAILSEDEPIEQELRQALNNYIMKENK